LIYLGTHIKQSSVRKNRNIEETKKKYKVVEAAVSVVYLLISSEQYIISLVRIEVERQIVKIA